MNYNNPLFWVLFGLIILPYWRMGLRTQNRFLLLASFCFYGFWDYRFLYLILLSTAIDFIGGLGVAGLQLKRAELRRLAAILVAAALLLTSGFPYAALLPTLQTSGWVGLLQILPSGWAAYKVTLATVLTCLAYGALLPWLYGLAESRRRTAFLVISLVANLGILCFFKYFDFFAASLSGLIEQFGWAPPSWVTLNLVLPAGISFYTFQAMSYTIDIYRKQLEPTRDFGDFALFVCFFPHLVAGPIMRAHNLLPQVTNARLWKPAAFEQGLYLVLMGLFKKLVLADNLAPIADGVFNIFAAGEGSKLGGSEVMLGLFAFAFQIYGDFSGYSSVARGISKWLGFELVINFRNPYLATSPSDFWHRWHISLSSWLRDYLYIPLGGNRGSAWRTFGNMQITMLLGGLWHGANWTFVAWGFFHANLLGLYRSLGNKLRLNAKLKDHAGRAISIILMFSLTCLGWLLFRAENLSTAWLMVTRLFTNLTGSSFALSGFVLALCYILPMFLFEAYYDSEHGISRFHEGSNLKKFAVYAYLLLMLILFAADQRHEFIYFQF